MIRNAIARFMYGRYGGDQLNLFLLGLYVALYLVYLVTHLAVFSWLSLALIVVALYRMLSRNPQRRRAENAKFMSVAGPVIRWFHLRRTMHRDKEHRYFKCPNCGQQLRVPRGKGRISVTCRACGATFEEKS